MCYRDNISDQHEINTDPLSMVGSETFTGFNLTLKTVTHNRKDIFNTGKVEEDLYEFKANSHIKDVEKITFLVTRFRVKDGKKCGDKTSWIVGRESFRNEFGVHTLVRVTYFFCKQC